MREKTKKKFHKVGQVVNYIGSVFIWMLERHVTRLPFFLVAILMCDTAHLLVRGMLGEKLLGASVYLPEDKRIGFWTIVCYVLAIAFYLLILAPIAEGIGSLLKRTLTRLRWRQDKCLYFNNEKVGKALLTIWSVIALICLFFNLVCFCEYSIWYGILIFIVDEVTLLYFFLWTYTMDPFETLNFLGIFCSGVGGGNSGGGSGGSYIIFKL